MMNDEMNIHDEFEDWLKQSADKHRMFPSDKLWRNINDQLHDQPNWPALTFGAILTMALITATLVFLHPTKNVFTLPNYASTSTPVSSIAPDTKIDSQTPALRPLQPVKQQQPVYAFNNRRTLPVSAISIEAPSLDQSFNVLGPTEATNPAPIAEVAVLQSALPKTTLNLRVSQSVPAVVPASEQQEKVVGEEAPSAVAVVEKEEVAQAEAAEPADNLTHRTIQLPRAHQKRWHLELYGGSNISYRRLSETMFDDHATASRPTSANRSSLNNIVSQKPSIGINAGLAFVYAVNDRLRLKTGLQINFRQYNIDAYKSGYERSVLLLNNGLYYPDSVYTYSAISNAQGRAIALSNKYYQLGIPVGVEWTAVKLTKLHLNLAANVQPTYQINSNNYLLTSDYKNYVQAPGLLRRININAGVEATANFNAGNLQWQVGPQVLYQTLPTQKANYSIHEHLIDYGIRVGIIKQL